jgi:hypothetical protein
MTGRAAHLHHAAQQVDEFLVIGTTISWWLFANKRIRKAQEFPPLYFT